MICRFSRCPFVEPGDRCPPSPRFRGGIFERNDAGSPGQDRPDDFPLDPDAASVDDPNFTESGAKGFVQVFLDHRLDFLGSERMKIETGLERNLNGVTKGMIVLLRACEITVGFWEVLIVAIGHHVLVVTRHRNRGGKPRAEKPRGETAGGETVNGETAAGRPWVGMQVNPGGQLDRSRQPEEDQRSAGSRSGKGHGFRRVDP